MAMDLNDQIGWRLTDLIRQGVELLKDQPVHDPSSLYMGQRSDAVAWLLSAVHVLEVALPPGNRHREEAIRLLPAPNDPLFVDRIDTILGILKSASAEWAAGTFRTLELHFVGLAFDDF